MLKEINITLIIIHSILCGHTIESTILNMLWQVELITMVYYLYGYNNKIKIINYSIFYIFNCTTIIIVINILRTLINFIDYHGDKELITKCLCFVVYIFLLSIYILKIKDTYNYYYKNSKDNFIIIFIITIAFVTLINSQGFLKEDYFSIDISLIISQIFILMISLYFFILYTKSKNIFKLNKCLELKNIELKEIKDKHATTIRYLQKMCDLDCRKDVGVILKEIISGNDNVLYNKQINCEKIISNERSLINIIVKNAVNKGIKVNFDNRFNISFIEINEMELYRIVTNIVNNAINVLKDIKDPTINIRIYKINTKAFIEIENNGPTIEEKNIENIFKRGFTTKENQDSSHGYGLSIVKELIENNDGTIEVTSREFKTVFKIVLPTKHDN